MYLLSYFNNLTSCSDKKIKSKIDAIGARAMTPPIFTKVCTDSGLPSNLPFFEACTALNITFEERKDGILFTFLPSSVLADDYLLRGQLLQEIEALYQKHKEQNKEQQSLLPSEWIEAIDILKTRKKPRDIKDERWGQILLRLERFVEQESDHLLKMVEIGWSLQEVFGCHKFAPDVRIDGMGLLMLLGDLPIAEITSTQAKIRHKDGATTSYRVGAYANKSEFCMLMDIP